MNELDVCVWTTKLSTKGQVVIPEAVRHILGMKAGTPFIVRIVDGKISLEIVK